MRARLAVAAASKTASKGDAAFAAASLTLAHTALRAGRPSEAFQRADRVIAIDVDNGEAWVLVAEALEALGEMKTAALACERALSLAPNRADLHARLGRLYETLDRPFDAAARYQRALALRPVLLDAHVALSGLFGRAGQLPQARVHAEAALALAPDCRGAHQNLAAIADQEGRFDEAVAHRERAYRGAPLIVTLAPRPRRRVLTLASAARANSPDRYLIPTSRYDRLVWFIAYADAAKPAPTDFDVVFNAIADDDAAAEGPAREFAASSDRPMLNPPDRIARTTRDAAARVFEGVDDLVVPETARVSPATDFKSSDPDELWLLRPIGSHGGERLERLPLSAVSRRLGPGEHYLTPFHEFRSDDGLYRKYRVFFVGGEPFPYHLAIHDDWLVHYQSARTAERREWITEERRFLENPEIALGARAWSAIRQVGAKLDLDFSGCDFAVLPDGHALLFEANATMYVHPEASDGPLAHKNTYVQRILEAFWTRLESA